MTVQEAYKTCFGKPYIVPIKEHNEAKGVIKQALEEVEQYRALGTVEEIEKKIQTELPYMSLAQARFKSELDEYRNIGTVEELKEAREKQVAKKPTFKGDFIGFYECECGAMVEKTMSYCCECGKKLDWSEEDD